MHRIRLRPDPPAGRQKCGTHDGSRNTRARISREGYGQSALGCAVSQVIGFHQGKERDPLGSCIRREETKLRRPALLGERVLRIHSGTRHRGHTGIHQEAGRGGQAPGAIESVAVTAAFRRLTAIGPASATPPAALSGPHPKAPGFAGGYLQHFQVCWESTRIERSRSGGMGGVGVW